MVSFGYLFMCKDKDIDFSLWKWERKIQKMGNEEGKMRICLIKFWKWEDRKRKCLFAWPNNDWWLKHHSRNLDMWPYRAKVCNLLRHWWGRLHTSALNYVHPYRCFCSVRSHMWPRHGIPSTWVYLVESRPLLGISTFIVGFSQVRAQKIFWAITFENL